MRDLEREFALRQVVFLDGKGLSTEESFERTERALGSEVQALFEQWTEGESGSVQSFEGSFLGRVVALAEPRGLDRRGVIMGYLKLRHRGMRTLLQGWSIFDPLSRYVLGVAVSATILFSIFVIFIAPQWTELFAFTGADLPALTDALLRGPWGTVLVGLPWLILSGVMIVNGINRRIIRAQRIPPRSLLFVPFVSGLLIWYSRWLYLASCRLFLNVGIDSAECISMSDELFRRSRLSRLVPPQSIGAQLRVAAELDTLDDELAYQQELVEFEYPIRVMEARERIAFVVRILLGVVIGALILALYLPIFKLGAVI